MNLLAKSPVYEANRPAQLGAIRLSRDKKKPQHKIKQIKTKQIDK